MTRASLRISAGRALSYQPAEVEDVHVIADSENQAHVMVDEQDTHTGAGKRAHMAAEFRCLVRVETGCRLVHQDEARPAGKRPGDAHELAPAVRQVLWRSLRDVVEPAYRQGPVGGAALLAAGEQQLDERADHADVVRGDQEVLLDRQVIEQLDRLKGPRQAAPRAQVRSHCR